MSIAIVAAVLACVTMLGHRSHNETLRLQGQALSLQTEASIKSTDTANQAGIKSTETANKWAYFQSKNLFNLESEIALDMMKASPKGPHLETKEFQDMVARYEDNVDYYMGNKDHRTRKSRKKQAGAEDDGKQGEGKLGRIEEEARNLEKETKEILKKGKTEVEEILKKAEVAIHQSHIEHLKAARLDYGELALQFAVVLCSLAILTKNRSFWFVGIVSALIGAAVTISAEAGLFMGGAVH